MNSIFITDQASLADTISKLDKATQEWEASAARGECGWICADCCCTFPEGMPNACVHGHESCTKIIERNKLEASKS